MEACKYEISNHKGDCYEYARNMENSDCFKCIESIVKSVDDKCFIGVIPCHYDNDNTVSRPASVQIGYKNDSYGTYYSKKISYIKSSSSCKEEQLKIVEVLRGFKDKLDKMSQELNQKKIDIKDKYEEEKYFKD